MNTNTPQTLLFLLFLSQLAACASAPAQAPFYVFDSTVLNVPDAQHTAPVIAEAKTQPQPKNATPSKTTPVAAPAPKPNTPEYRRDPRFVPAHSAGYIRAVYAVNTIQLDRLDPKNAVADLYKQVEKRGKIYHATRPSVGDLVFFHNTSDHNEDGRNNDWHTHVGLVEYVEKDGTIHVLSYLNKEITSFVINLEQPKLAKDERTGKTWNTHLRTKNKHDPAFTQYLGGELFAAFGNLLGDRTEFVVIDNWEPGMDVQ